MQRVTLPTLKVLKALMDEPTKETYGLQLIQKTGLASGSLYPILIRLESLKWLESHWENIDPIAEGRKPRKYYQLTGLGQREARTHLEKLNNAFGFSPAGVQHV